MEMETSRQSLTCEKKTSESIQAELDKMVQITKDKKDKINQFRLTIESLDETRFKLIQERCQLENDINDAMFNMTDICDLGNIKKQLKSLNVIDKNEQIVSNLTNTQIDSIWKLHSFVTMRFCHFSFMIVCVVYFCVASSHDLQYSFSIDAWFYVYCFYTWHDHAHIDKIKKNIEHCLRQCNLDSTEIFCDLISRNLNDNDNKKNNNQIKQIGKEIIADIKAGNKNKSKTDIKVRNNKNKQDDENCQSSSVGNINIDYWTNKSSHLTQLHRMNQMMSKLFEKQDCFDKYDFSPFNLNFDKEEDEKQSEKTKANNQDTNENSGSEEDIDIDMVTPGDEKEKEKEKEKEQETEKEREEENKRLDAKIVELNKDKTEKLEKKKELAMKLKKMKGKQKGKEKSKKSKNSKQGKKSNSKLKFTKTDKLEIEDGDGVDYAKKCKVESNLYKSDSPRYLYLYTHETKPNRNLQDN